MAFRRSFTRKDPAAVLDYEFDWSTWLGADTISTSDVMVPTGITLSNETNTATTATAWLSGGTAGTTYRVLNTITTAGGRIEDWVLIVALDGVLAGTAYLSPDDAAARLWGRFDIEADISTGDIQTASNELEGMGPFIGVRQVAGQELAFPRSKSPDGTDNTDPAVPEAVLDWVALTAYQLSVDEDPPIQSMGVLDRSLTYDSPKISQTEKRKRRLLEPYLAHSGGFDTLGVTSTFDPPASLLVDFGAPVSWPMTEFP